MDSRFISKLKFGDFTQYAIKRLKGFFVISKASKRNLGGPYRSRKQARKRLRQVEFFKRLGK